MERDERRRVSHCWLEMELMVYCQTASSILDVDEEGYRDIALFIHYFIYNQSEHLLEHGISGNVQCLSEPYSEQFITIQCQPPVSAW